MRAFQGPLAIASDHAGFPLKKDVERILSQQGEQYEDLGCDSTQSCDYPDFAQNLTDAMASGRFARGILICGSGIGMAIAANRHPGIRAAVCINEDMARVSRQHNDTNVLCLGARLTDAAGAEKIVAAWLGSTFEGGRHSRRIAKLETTPGVRTQGRSVRVVEHPLVQHKLTYLRDERTDSKIFREILDELSTLLAYEVTRDLPVDAKRVTTPMKTEAEGRFVRAERIGIVPILRAGLGMMHGILKVIPMAAVGHMGIFRDHGTLKPITYYTKLPGNLEDRVIIVVDPMLATGGSAVAAIEEIKRKGGRTVKFACLLAAPEGIEVLHGTHPDVEIVTAAIDTRLNEKGYILPGLGDAGDRLFGTR